MKGHSNDANTQKYHTRQGQEIRTSKEMGRIKKSNMEDKILASYATEHEDGEGSIINSQVYGFSMRRKRNLASSNIQQGTTVRSFTQYNDLQSSRCQSNISLDSLLTQYKHNNKTKNPNFPKKVSISKST